MSDDLPGAIQLTAGPPSAHPPLPIACAIAGLSFVAPFLFIKAAAPGPLLGIAIIALAAAGVITMVAAVAGQRRRRADAAVRPRATIAPDGITLHSSPAGGAAKHFEVEFIQSASLLPHALVIQTTEEHPKPGRHVMRFGKLHTPRETLTAALLALTKRI
jgi:hypothetical protein